MRITSFHMCQLEGDNLGDWIFMTQVILEMHVLIASNFRPHPLTKRNGLVNQVKFCELAHNFAAVELNLAMIKKICGQPMHSRIVKWRWTNVTVVKKVLNNNYQSCNLIGPYHFKPKEFDFTHKTASHWEMCVCWARDTCGHCSYHCFDAPWPM